MLRACLVAAMLVAVGGAATADPIPPRVRLKEEHLRKVQEERKHANDKPPFQFAAPEGLTVGPPPLVKDAPYPDFYASSPGATMIVFVEKGAVVINDELVDDEVKSQSDKFTFHHEGGSAKLLKKELVKLDETNSAVRIVLETRADAGKKTKPMREIIYVVGGATHHARVRYITSPQNLAKLEKKFDASLRKTIGLLPVAVKPAVDAQRSP